MGREMCVECGKKRPGYEMYSHLDGHGSWERLCFICFIDRINATMASLRAEVRELKSHLSPKAEVKS